ncbi:MAG: response regulator [candidate division KSB1 bacterium]|nr:response regulator [candidate division KSB1 bacterium]
MNCLLISHKLERNQDELIAFLRRHHVEVDTAEDQWNGLHKAHQKQYDVVVLDAESVGDPIDGAIRLLRDCNPMVRIIVQAEKNSRDLEAAARKEKIFFYHVTSFGKKEIKTALSYALGLKQDA